MPGAGTATATQDTTKHSLEAGNTQSATSGTQQQQQQQQQQSSSNVGPWQATQPLLSNILTSLGGMSTQPSPGQSEAVAGLQSAASGVPNFGGQAAGLTSDLFSSAPKYNGMLTGGLADYKSGLSPFLDPSFLNPNSTPGFSDAINTLKSDITNQVNGQFAAAGRDLSPGNTTALARGLTQGIAPVIANQFNQNVATQRGAQDAGQGALYNTTGLLSGFDQTALSNRLQGIGAATGLPNVYTTPATARLGAANTAYGMPYSNLGMLEGLTLPISQLGQSSNSVGSSAGSGWGSTTGNMAGSYSGQGMGTQNTVGTQTRSPLDMINSLLSGGGGSSAATLMSMLSDERAKEDIEPVGMLFDGQTVHAYRYKGDPRPQIGLIAQEVEETAPHAVAEIGGLKHVDYGRATARARHIGGMLDDLNLLAA